MKFAVLAIFLSLSATAIFADGSLKFVAVLYRHGARSPAFVYPNDPYPESMWESGLGQLTKPGKNQMYLLGKYMRDRYANFLPVIYNEKDIQVISSDISRALMSAYACLAGLYPPQGKDVWLPKMDWQPIPVHSLSSCQDNILYNAKNCSKHGMLLQKYITENFEEVEQDELQKVLSLAGIPIKIDSLNYNYLLLGLAMYDCLFVEETYNLTLPEWTVDYYPEPLREIALFTYSSLSATKEMRRLRCGPLLKEILTHFDGVQQGTLSKKMYQYSAHDQTIVDLLQCLDVYDGELVPFASAVFLELYETNNVFEVLVSYKKGDVMKELIIPGCNNMVLCPLDVFKGAVSDVIPFDWEKECESD